MRKRSLGQQSLFAIFGTFGRHVTNLRGTFVENVKKKIKNQPTLMVNVYSLKLFFSYLGSKLFTFLAIKTGKVCCILNI
jgi:hypothetical protein